MARHYEMSKKSRAKAVGLGLAVEIAHINELLNMSLKLHHAQNGSWYISDAERPHMDAVRVGGATHLSAALQFLAWLRGVPAAEPTVRHAGNPDAVPPACK